MKTVALYPGRFQPFGRHHFAIHERLRERFGEVCVVTQAQTGSPRNPFSFEEKRRILAGYGIPPERLIREERDLTPEAVLRQLGFDPRSTAAVVGSGTRHPEMRQDLERRYTPLEGHEGNLLPVTERCYFAIVDDDIPVVEGRPMSGTWIRELLGRSGSGEETRRLFREVFGWYDEEICRMVASKLRGVESAG